MGRDPESVELGRDPPAAPAVTGETVVDPANDAGRGEPTRQGRLVGDEVRGLADALDAIAVGDNPAGVASGPRGFGHSVGRAPQEHPPLVGSDRRLDIEHELVRLTLDGADQANSEAIKFAAGQRQADEVAAEPIEPIDPDLGEAPGPRVREEASTVRALRHGHSAGDPLVGVLPDNNNAGLMFDAAADLADLRPDRASLGLVLAGDANVDRDPAARHLANQR